MRDIGWHRECMTNFEDFALNALPVPPCRVLEVGAGNGQLARALRRAGYDVLAIDPAAEDVEAVAQTAIEDLDSSVGPFSAVVANRSLHHLRDLEIGLDRIVDLLPSDGMLILQEFSWDQVDDTTGVWLQREAHRLGLLGDDERGDRWLERWRGDHRDLATFAQLTEALERRFTQLHFSWIPYLAEEYLDADPTAVSREHELLDQGRIQAAAFRYIGCT